MEEVLDPHPARPGAGRGRELRAVDDVDVAVDDQGVAMCDMVERAIDRMRDPVAADVVHGQGEVARLDRIGVHRRAVGETRKSDLSDAGARQAVLYQSAN